MQPSSRRRRLRPAVRPAIRPAVGRAVLVAAVALVALACVDPVTDPTSTADLDSGAVDRGPSATGPDRPCDAEVEAATVDTIATQLDDFARGDFAAALSRATSTFQSGTDVAGFRALIEDGYPLLVQEATVELVRCSRQGPGTVAVGVEVITADRVSAPFAYRLRLDGGRWAIDAAVRLTPPPATA